MHSPPPPVLPPDNVNHVNNLPYEGQDLGDLYEAQNDHEPETTDGPEGASKSGHTNEIQGAVEIEDANEAEDVIEDQEL